MTEQIEESEIEQQEILDEPTGEDSPALDDNEAGEPSEPEVEDSQPEGPSKGVQKRIDELTRQKYEKQREAEYWKSLAEKQDEPVEIEKPDFDNFETSEDYLEALAEFKANEVIKKQDQTRAKDSEAKEVAAKRESFNARIEAKDDKPSDFYDVIYNDSVSINDGMAEFITESELGPDVAYYLGKNPHEAHRIASLSPIMAGRELTRIEQTVSSKPAKATNAPSPISPVGGKAKVTKDPANMTDNEFNEWRRKTTKYKRR